MTRKCIKQVQKLQQKNGKFNDLSVEQLLYAAIIGSDFEEVKTVLEITDWSKYCAGEYGSMVEKYVPSAL